jgi:hypothetical protein
VQDLECTLVSGDVQLVPGAPVEGVTCVRSDLGHDIERAQEAERSTSDRGIADVEMHGDLAAALEMHASSGMEEPRELGQAIALAARRDRRELVPEILRK